MLIALAFSLFVSWLPLCLSHASIFHSSMYGFNVTFNTFPYDNRPVAPLFNYTFDQWWFHGHLDYPPHPEDFLELPAGQAAKTEIACSKTATSYWESSDGGNAQQGDNPCPNSDTSAIHTTGLDDVTGCALAIAYKSDVRSVQPEDFAVFSVNQTCVWHRFTDFQVPERMPPCPEGGCICAWFWIHSPDSGSEQNYMTGFKCNVTGSTSNVPIARPQLARRCGDDPNNGRPQGSLGNCTYGAKQPFYWLQAERNNMFEGYYSPPFYTDLYNFRDGAQNDIFVDSYAEIPPPSPDSTIIPTPLAHTSVASPSTTVTNTPPTSNTNSAVPTSAATHKSTICKLSNDIGLYSNVELHRRSFFHDFMDRSRKRRSAKGFNLWHPF